MTEDRNDDKLTHDTDTVDDVRERAMIRMAVYQQRVAHRYNKT